MRIDNEKKIVLRINRDTSISLNNQIILADSSSNDISVRLPNLLSQLNQLTSQGYFFEVKKISSSNSVFIIPPSGQLIDNQALITLSNLNEGVYLKFDGNNYQIVSSIIYGSSGGSSYITSVSDTSTVNLTVINSNLKADFTSMNISQFTNDSGYLTASGLSGYVPTSRTISINGTSYDLSSNRSWSVGTITSIALSGGTGISISGSPITTSGTITVTNTAPDQTVTLNNGTGISVTGTYPTFTITNSSPDQTVVLNSGNYITVSGTYPTFTITGNPPRLPLILTTSDNSLTSTVSETKVFSQQIAGSTFAAGDAIVMLARFRKVGTAGATATFRFYINSSDSLSGATLIATSALSGSTNISAVFQRNPVCKSSNIIEFWTASSSVFTDMTQTTTAVSNIAYTYANAYYWIVSIQMANTADTGILSSFLVERIRL